MSILQLPKMLVMTADISVHSNENRHVVLVTHCLQRCSLEHHQLTPDQINHHRHSFVNSASEYIVVRYLCGVHLYLK
jgi:hypothetical protein